MSNILISIFIFLLNKFISPSCVEEQNNCLICDPSNNLCLKCILDNLFPDENGGCESKCIIGKNYCNECSEDSKLCIECELGYFPDKIGGCSYTPNCESSYRGNCLICEEEYILIGEKNNFQICKNKNSEDLKHCKIINEINGFCEECEEGFFLNEGDLKCSKIENCFESIYSICSSCINGYYLNKKLNKCIKSEENFMYCKETIDGENCDTCFSGFYLSENGNCVNTIKCLEAENGKCVKCVEHFYLTNDNYCSTDKNCEYSDGNTALCNYCHSGYYLDNKDKKCKKQEGEEFNHCMIYEEGCIECEIDYHLGEDLKCTKTKNCKESEGEKCLECKEGYYLGKDNKCNSIEHCIYSGTTFECDECEDGYYFNVYNKTCLKSEGNLKNCKILIFEKNKCSLCKDNYYLNKTDYLCYKNTDKNSKFHNCEFTDYNGEKCDKCKEGYFLTSGDEKCITVANCKYSKNEKECDICDEYYCLDQKNNKCIINDYLQNENDKIFIACNKTNKEGDKCELCLDGYEVNAKGYCVDMKRCEKKENGICTKCKNDNDSDGYYYCANEIYGCLKTIIMGCKQCNDLDNLYSCTECHNGYYLNDIKQCNRE